MQSDSSTTSDLHPIFVIGAGWHGKEVARYLSQPDASSPYRLAGFVDPVKPVGEFAESRILGSFNELRRILEDQKDRLHFYITATGDNRVRRSFVERIESLSARNLTAAVLRHGGCWSGKGNRIGDGTCLAPGSILTTDVTVGRHCIVNVKASASHDCRIGDFVNLNPGATLCGNVVVEEGAYIGAGATVKDNIRIGAWSVVGAGAVVIRDVAAGSTVVGVPARAMRKPETRKEGAR